MTGFVCFGHFPDGNDGANFSNNDENSYNVIKNSYLDNTAILDGFTITGGYANGGDDDQRGGGMFNGFSSSPTITNCSFRGNRALTADGGGMYNAYSSAPSLKNCTFSSNTALSNGGGICNYSGIETLTNCIIWGNRGGGMVGSGPLDAPTDGGVTLLLTLGLVYGGRIIYYLSKR